MRFYVRVDKRPIMRSHGIQIPIYTLDQSKVDSLNLFYSIKASIFLYKNIKD